MTKPIQLAELEQSVGLTG